MPEATPQFKPRTISSAEFRRSNLFMAWSRKLGRRVNLIGPTQYDAWLILEFDSDVKWFCERPPVHVELVPLEGKRRFLDFWAQRSSGMQFGVALHDVTLPNDKTCSFERLKRSLDVSKLKCEIWLGSDMRSRVVYVRNLKHLQPFVAMDQTTDEQLAMTLVAHLERVKKASWSELITLCASRFEGTVNVEIAKLIHKGRITANLADHALASNTMLSLP